MNEHLSFFFGARWPNDVSWTQRRIPWPVDPPGTPFRGLYDVAFGLVERDHACISRDGQNTVIDARRGLEPFDFYKIPVMNCETHSSDRYADGLARCRECSTALGALTVSVRTPFEAHDLHEPYVFAGSLLQDSVFKGSSCWLEEFSVVCLNNVASGFGTRQPFDLQQ